MDIYFVRHGETDWNAARRVQGRSDIPLNEYGIELAYRTKEGLQKEGIVFDSAFSSPLVRAYKTAQIILEDTDVVPVKDDRLLEMDFGIYDGMSIIDARNGKTNKMFSNCMKDPGKYFPKPGEAESFEQLYARAKSFLEDVLMPLEGNAQCVLVSIHGALIRAFIGVIEGIPISEFWNIHQLNCAVNKVTLQDGNFEVIYKSRLFYEPEHVYFDPKTGKEIKQ